MARRFALWTLDVHDVGKMAVLGGVLGYRIEPDDHGDAHRCRARLDHGGDEREECFHMRRRVFDTGQGRTTDPVDAHSVAVAGLRSPGLRSVAADDVTVVLRLLVDRRAELLGLQRPGDGWAFAGCCGATGEEGLDCGVG
jgi:hypothetical protein